MLVQGFPNFTPARAYDMTEHNNQHGEYPAARTVIRAEALFSRLRRQHAARVEARRYLLAARKAAIQRRLLMHILNSGRNSSGPDRAD
jgi:hypothetical protein